MKKALLILFLGFVALVQDVEATQPLRKFYPVKQSDGTTIQVRKCGNGRFVFYCTKDGLALMRSANGDLHYAEKSEEGLRSSAVLAHESSLRSADEVRYTSEKTVGYENAYQLMSLRFALPEKSGRTYVESDGLVPLGESGPGVVSSIGKPKIPVIMVSFSDCDFLESTTPEKVSRMLNEKGYSDEKYCKGSVRDYFISQSEGLLAPSYDVVAKVKVSRPYAYYGQNYATGAIDKNVTVLVQEALDSASVSGVDFKKYVSAQGRVPLVSIYHAGPGEHSSFEKGAEDYVWAHFSKRGFNVDGVGINSYLVSNELLQKYELDDDGQIKIVSAGIDGMGIFVHEFGHALGLPDFYPTGNVSSDEIHTMHFWSVMDYGQYFYDGYAPVGYNAFERASLGWIELKELSTPVYAALYPFDKADEGTTAYCIRNKENPKEYYILENRQPNTWYSKLMGNGMLITHVDYDKKRWEQNNLNTESDHQRFEFIPADNVKPAVRENGKSDWNGIKADLFPGRNNVTEFTDSTLPAANVYTGGKLHQPIYNIKEKEGVVYFSFMDETLTGIDQILDERSEGEVDIFTLTGHKVAPGMKLLPGIYIVKINGHSQKLYIK